MRYLSTLAFWKFRMLTHSTQVDKICSTQSMTREQKEYWKNPAQMRLCTKTNISIFNIYVWYTRLTVLSISLKFWICFVLKFRQCKINRTLKVRQRFIKCLPTYNPTRLNNRKEPHRLRITIAKTQMWSSKLWGQISVFSRFVKNLKLDILGLLKVEKATSLQSGSAWYSNWKWYDSTFLILVQWVLKKHGPFQEKCISSAWKVIVQRIRLSKVRCSRNWRITLG